MWVCARSNDVHDVHAPDLPNYGLGTPAAHGTRHTQQGHRAALVASSLSPLKRTVDDHAGCCRLKLMLPIVLALVATASAQSQQRVTRVNAPAEVVIGKIDRHARAISCTNGAWFESITQHVTDEHIVGIELCCSADGAIWFEGASSDFTEQCYWIGEQGSSKGAPRPTSCSPLLALHASVTCLLHAFMAVHSWQPSLCTVLLPACGYTR
jgi:hypothetical protein